MSGTVTTSKASEFEDALIAQLQARAELAGVQVDVGPLGDDTAAEYIQSMGASSSQEWGSLGNRLKEEYIDLTLEVKAEAVGGGPAVIRAARDRCDALIAEIETQLRQDHHVNGTAVAAQITRVETPKRGIGTERTERAEIREVTVTAHLRLPLT